MATALEKIPNVLSIAGSDPCGGAGIQADLKTFAALRCYGLSAITALTAQNTQGVEDLCILPPAFVAAQIDALFADCAIKAVKIGMTASPDNIEIIGDRLARYRP
ncbi:MAG TPA: bifunctional hydroxymethylpyrimidine kinase/phosphomethylpyrimidine kinase, partial [Methylovirgula sp.]